MEEKAKSLKIDLSTAFCRLKRFWFQKNDRFWQIKKVIFDLDNTRPHVAKWTLQKFRFEMGNSPALGGLSWLGSFRFSLVPVSAEQFKWKIGLNTVSRKLPRNLLPKENLENGRRQLLKIMETMDLINKCLLGSIWNFLIGHRFLQWPNVLVVHDVLIDIFSEDRNKHKYSQSSNDKTAFQVKGPVHLSG